MKILSALVTLQIFLSGCSHQPVIQDKKSIQKIRLAPDRGGGLLQLTGRNLSLGQTKFPQRTPADPVPFVDPFSGEVYIYGTQVDGTGFSYLKYKNKSDLLRGAEPEIFSRDVYLPNGRRMSGKEAIWDTYRLSYKTLVEVFSEATVRMFYQRHKIKPASDLFFGGVALQEDGSLGRWIQDNWRRRVHPIAEINGRLQIIKTPVFNTIKSGPTLKGDYIGHAYGPNFKIVMNGNKKEMWIISEEINRRVEENLGPAEVTEIFARRMVNPFKADPAAVLMVTLNDESGKPHPDSDRGIEMAHAKLIEGFRPTNLSPEGITFKNCTKKIEGKCLLKVNTNVDYLTLKDLEKKHFYYMVGSQGNFAGDAYDVIAAVRPENAIGKYDIIKNPGRKDWKKLISSLKKKYNLSWAGRGSFLKDDNEEWWLLFHAVDKDLKPDGSYGGVIPPNTEEYHRNLYIVPIEFYLNETGEPDLRIIAN